MARVVDLLIHQVGCSPLRGLVLAYCSLTEWPYLLEWRFCISQPERNLLPAKGRRTDKDFCGQSPLANTARCSALFVAGGASGRPLWSAWDGGGTGSTSLPVIRPTGAFLSPCRELRSMSLTS